MEKTEIINMIDSLESATARMRKLINQSKDLLKDQLLIDHEMQSLEADRERQWRWIREFREKNLHD